MGISEAEMNYELLVNSPYNQKEKFLWRASHVDTVQLLEAGASLKDTSTFFERYSINELVDPVLEKWKYSDLILSALYCHLANIISERKIRKIALITSYDWQIITKIVINAQLTNHIKNFIEEMNLKQISSRELIILGTRTALKGVYRFDEAVSEKGSKIGKIRQIASPLKGSPEFLKVRVQEERDINLKRHERDQVGVKNLLKILEIDTPIAQSLIDDSFTEKSFEKLITYLLAFQNGLQDYVPFIQVLQIYKDYKSLPFLKEEVGKALTNKFQNVLAELESFDIFDLFDSFEGAKIKMPEMWAYQFTEKLLTAVSENKEEEMISCFTLFEKYTKEKKVSLKNVTIEELPKISEDFCLEKSQEIDEIVQKRSNYFERDVFSGPLKNWPKGEKFLAVALTFLSLAPLIFPISPSSKSFKPPFAGININPTFVNLSQPFTSSRTVSPTPIKTYTPYRVRGLGSRNVLTTASSRNTPIKVQPMRSLKTLQSLPPAQQAIVVSAWNDVYGAVRRAQRPTTIIKINDIVGKTNTTFVIDLLNTAGNYKEIGNVKDAMKKAILTLETNLRFVKECCADIPVGC